MLFLRRYCWILCFLRIDRVYHLCRCEDWKAQHVVQKQRPSLCVLLSTIGARSISYRHDICMHRSCRLHFVIQLHRTSYRPAHKGQKLRILLHTLMDSMLQLWTLRICSWRLGRNWKMRVLTPFHSGSNTLSGEIRMRFSKPALLLFHKYANM